MLRVDVLNNYGGYMNTTAGELNTTDPFHAEVGRRIGEAILQEGTSMKALAEATGISYSSIRRTIAGTRDPGIKNLALISRNLRRQPHHFIPEAD